MPTRTVGSSDGSTGGEYLNSDAATVDPEDESLTTAMGRGLSSEKGQAYIDTVDGSVVLTSRLTACAKGGASRAKDVSIEQSMARKDVAGQ